MASIFDEPIERRGTNSYKWDTTTGGVLPMWVADMDFRTAPPIIEALQRRVAHGVFGYTHVPAEYYRATVNWFAKRHGWDINPDSIIYTSGVVPAISAIIKALTEKGSGVAVLTPVYNCFFSSIRNNDCRVESCPMIERSGKYYIDFKAFEHTVSQPHVRIFLLCNPHNPGGRVWTREELLHLAEICNRHNVIVVSDEIHCELTFPDHKYTPFASLSPEIAAKCVSCVSPTKAFNIAGLQIANIVCGNTEMRAAIDKAININEVCDVNPFGVEALIAAYTHGAPWLEELKEYLHGNYLALREYMAANLPQLTVMHSESTYLAWIDCRSLGMDSEDICTRLVDNAALMLSPGSIYGTAGNGFVRLNFACPRSVLLQGLTRLTTGIGSL